jgi:hypothetical protein
MAKVLTFEARRRAHMSRITPRLFYEYFVVPNYDDFCGDRTDVRRAFNASVAAFQMADIFLYYYQRVDRSVVKAWPTRKPLLIYLGKREPYFVTVQSVATVYKHLYASKGHCEIGSPMAVWGTVTYGKTEITNNEWGGNATSGEVVVKRRHGPDVLLRIALEAVIRMWGDFLPSEHA